MNKYEKRIKELKDENLDLKIKIRIEENNRKEAEKRSNLKSYNAIIIGYCFANCIAGIIGETLTFVVCFIAIFGLFWIERRRSKWYGEY